MRNLGWSNSAMLGILLFGFCSFEAGADVIDNFPTQLDTFGCIGEGAGCTPYPGQTFVALGPLAQSLGFAVVGTTSVGFNAGLDFRLLMTEMQANGQNPGAVLFESQDISVPAGQPSNITVNLGGLFLNPGETFAFILDFFVLFDGVVGTGEIFMSNNGSGDPDTYSQGKLIFPVFGDLSGTDRTAHFNQLWRGDGTGSHADIAFTMQFGDSALDIPSVTVTPLVSGPVPVPEPSTALLLGTGLAALAARRRKRTKS